MTGELRLALQPDVHGWQLRVELDVLDYIQQMRAADYRVSLIRHAADVVLRVESDTAGALFHLPANAEGQIIGLTRHFSTWTLLRAHAFDCLPAYQLLARHHPDRLAVTLPNGRTTTWEHLPPEEPSYVTQRTSTRRAPPRRRTRWP